MDSGAVWRVIAPLAAWVGLSPAFICVHYRRRHCNPATDFRGFRRGKCRVRQQRRLGKIMARYPGFQAYVSVSLRNLQ